MQTDQHTTAAPGGAQPSAPLRRDTDNKVVAGVCAGLGRHFGIDPIIFRIGFVALTLAGAAGLAIYGLAWLFVPEEGQEESIASGVLHSDRISTHVGAWTLAVIAMVVLFGSWADRDDNGGLVVALILGGAAVALLSSRSSNRPTTPPAAPPAGGWDGGGTAPGDGRPGGRSATEHDEATLEAGDGRPGDRSAAEHDEATPGLQPVGTTAPGDNLSSGTATSSVWRPTQPTATAARPARPQRPPRSPLGRITISLVSILGGVMLLLDRTGAADVTLAAFLSLSLLIVGLALVAGAWWGRSRGLIVVGVLLAGSAAAATLVDVPLGAGIGDRTYRPVGAADLDPSYRLAVGELTLDLRGAAPAPGQLEVVTARVGVGHLVVLLPESAAVEVDGRVGAGELVMLGRTDEGTNVRHRSEVPAATEGAGRIELRVSAGAGQVEVRR